MNDERREQIERRISEANAARRARTSAAAAEKDPPAAAATKDPPAAAPSTSDSREDRIARKLRENGGNSSKIAAKNPPAAATATAAAPSDSNSQGDKIARKLRENGGKSSRSAAKDPPPAAAAIDYGAKSAPDEFDDSHKAKEKDKRESAIQAKIREAHSMPSSNDEQTYNDKNEDEFGKGIEPPGPVEQYDGPLLTAEVTFGDEPKFNEPVYDESEGVYGGIGAVIVPEDTLDDFLVSGMIIDEDLEQQEIQEDKKRSIKRVICYAMCGLSVALAISIPVGLHLFKKNKGTKSPTMTPTTVPSSIPSSAPTSARFDMFGQKLSDISNPELFRNNTSPQFRALSFIANEDDIEVSAANLVQRYIMAVFYFSLNGDEWTLCGKQENEECDCKDDSSGTVICGNIKTNDKPYLRGSECNWFKTKCDGDGEDAVITRIDFNTFSNGLKGELPSELRHLKSLQILKIGNNRPVYEKAAEVPPKKKALKAINALSGTIPDFIGHNLTNLEQLALPFNKFTGTIPDSLYELKKLKVLNLQGNVLTGTISPKIEQLTNLVQANFSSNFFTGSVPENFGSLGKLTNLHLFRNEFNGTMPESVCLLEIEKLSADCVDDTEVKCECCTECFDESESKWKRFYDPDTLV